MLNPSINRRRLSVKSEVSYSTSRLCVLLFPLAALRLSAQNLSGKTSGTIHDPSGTGVANATIIMTNHEAKTIDMTTTDREGNFVLQTVAGWKLRAAGFEARLRSLSRTAGLARRRSRLSLKHSLCKWERSPNT